MVNLVGAPNVRPPLSEPIIDKFASVSYTVSLQCVYSLPRPISFIAIPYLDIAGCPECLVLKSSSFSDNKMIGFLDLVEDVLCHIFSYLDPVDLSSLLELGEFKVTSAVQMQLRRIYGSLLITGSECFNGVNSEDSLDDRLRIHCNWAKGQHHPIILFDDDSIKYIGRMRLDKEHFYLSNKGQLRIYGRSPENHRLPSDSFRSYCDIEDPVISMMALNGEHLFVGNYYGSCTYIRNGELKIDAQKIHDSYKDIVSMDYHAETQVLASSNFREIKLFRVGSSEMTTIGELDWRGRCLKIDSTGDQMIVGNVCTDFHSATGFITKLDALSLFDLGTLEKRTLNCVSNGVVDMQWHTNPQLVITGHWTGDLRVFDLRTDSDQIVIMRELSADLNVSVKYDGQFGVACGYRNSCAVSLYDLRQPKKHYVVFQREKPFEDPTQRSYLQEIFVEPQHLFVVHSEGVHACDYNK